MCINAKKKPLRRHRHASCLDASSTAVPPARYGFLQKSMLHLLCPSSSLLIVDCLSCWSDNQLKCWESLFHTSIWHSRFNHTHHIYSQFLGVMVWIDWYFVALFFEIQRTFLRNFWCQLKIFFEKLGENNNFDRKENNSHQTNIKKKYFKKHRNVTLVLFPKRNEKRSASVAASTRRNCLRLASLAPRTNV